jgi:soluble lytic murein transglycosylase-like protein
MQHESGGHPYALRINAGRGYSLYPNSWQEAVHIVTAIRPLTRNIDLGLMQVNLRIWGPHFGLTAAQLLEPTMNMRVGCDILRRALSTEGPAWQRIGRYHSGRPARQRRYAWKIVRTMETLRQPR